MARQERYNTVEMQTDEETHLLKRIAELEEQVDKLATVLNEHRHEGDRIVVDAAWAL